MSPITVISVTQAGSLTVLSMFTLAERTIFLEDLPTRILYSPSETHQSEISVLYHANALLSSTKETVFVSPALRLTFSKPLSSFSGLEISPVRSET